LSAFLREVSGPAGGLSAISGDQDRRRTRHQHWL